MSDEPLVVPDQRTTSVQLHLKIHVRSAVAVLLLPDQSCDKVGKRDIWDKSKAEWSVVALEGPLSSAEVGTALEWVVELVVVDKVRMLLQDELERKVRS